jgi:putative copper export protein/mono/diheme cytochrome c family protein
MDAALALTRGLLLLAELQAFGALAAYALVGPYRLWSVLGPSLLGLAASLAVWLVLQAAVMADAGSVGEAAHALVLVVSATVVGHAAVLRALAWTATAITARFSPRLAVVPAAIALALHEAAGHAVAEQDDLLIGAVTLHVLAAGAWLGGLLPLRLALRGENPAAVARRFSHLGTVCVAVLGVTAIVQANALAGGVPGLLGTAFGRVLLVKLALFAMLILLAWRNRFVLTPRLAENPLALHRSLAVEIGIGIVLVAAAALLAELPPGAHEQPTWPLPWRISLDALDDPDLRAEAIGAGMRLLGAACLIGLSFVWPRRRWAVLAAAAVIAWLAVPHLDFLLVPTEPTYYWESESSGGPDAIARGAATYAANCVSCHGAGGHGDGPLAAGMRIPPADLTAPHLWDHSEGELYWWISHGMPGPDGAPVMPGFAATLTPMARWELIDFLHANNPTHPLAGAPHNHHH